MVFSVIFEYNRQKNVLFRIVHIYLKYILTQNKSVPIPMPDLGNTFPSAIHPWSIITGQGRGREWIKVIRESLTQRYWWLPSKIIWC